MKRTLIAAVAIVVALVATNVQASDTSASKYSAPSWRYQWFEGRWWYWMPENRWVYWSGANWAPFPQSGQTHTSFYGNYETEGTPVAAAPVSSGGAYCPQPSYSVPYSAAWNGSGYGGYGWSWGPGTAFRNSPGGRF